VIILQSDHSFSDGAKRAINFQAYYFPEKPGFTINESFTNVNTFRLVFNSYFNEELPLLSDKSMQIDASYASFVEPIPSSCTSNRSEK
jgi:hypothetical protein